MIPLELTLVIPVELAVDWPLVRGRVVSPTRVANVKDSSMTRGNVILCSRSRRREDEYLRRISGTWQVGDDSQVKGL